MTGYDAADFLKPGIERKLSVVYYLQRADGAVKIGWSVNLGQRVKQLERLHGPLTLLIWEPGDRATEQARHREFTEDCLDTRYEWFRPSPALLAHVAEVRGELVEMMEIWGDEFPPMLTQGGRALDFAEEA